MDLPVLGSDICRKNSGASDLSKVTLSQNDDTCYRLFCVPENILECANMWRKYIGQGITICLAKNCSTNHRKSEQILIVPKQLFVVKTKDIVFLEPTLDLEVDDVLLTKWKYQSHPIEVWREKFQHAKGVAEIGDNLAEDNINKEEKQENLALEFKTPSKRRIRESLEEVDQDLFNGLEIADVITQQNLKAYLSKMIGTYSKTNQIMIHFTIPNYI